MRKPRILISILNWNKARQILASLDSVADDIKLTSGDVTVLVIDNGSKPEDVVLLESSVCEKRFSFRALPTDLGFTGGRNAAIKTAIDESYDFIWMLNNDATVIPGALSDLFVTMQLNSRCGAASPVIRATGDEQYVTSCLNTHNWGNRECTRITPMQEGQHIQTKSLAS